MQKKRECKKDYARSVAKKVSGRDEEWHKEESKKVCSASEERDCECAGGFVLCVCFERE